MKHLKMFGLAAMAAMALMGLVGVGSASATTLTSPTGTVYTGEIDASLEPGTSALLEAGFFNITCTTSTVKGQPNAQSDTTTVNGPINTLTFGSTATPCNATVTVITNGSLEIHAIGTGNEVNGTLTGKSSEVTVAALGTSCVYGTSTGTDLGTLTGTQKTGGTATMDIEASLPRISGGFACANPAKWTGKYTVTTPDSLWIDG
jgi:hypothetical protein